MVRYIVSKTHCLFLVTVGFVSSQQWVRVTGKVRYIVSKTHCLFLVTVGFVSSQQWVRVTGKVRYIVSKTHCLFLVNVVLFHHSSGLGLQVRLGISFPKHTAYF